MICELCGTELEPTAVMCRGCGARVGSAKGRDVDWRQQVKDSVARHREKKRREQEKRDDDQRQLSIFPEPREVPEVVDESEVRERKRRAEIRARVEERLARRRPAPSMSIGRVVDAGELPLGRGSGAAATAVARQLVGESVPVARADTDREPALDPRTVDLDPLAEARLGRVDVDGAEPLDALDAAPTATLGLASGLDRLFSGIVDLTFVALIQLTLFYLTTHLVAQRMGALPRSALVSMGLVGAVLAAGYFLFFWSLSGQTLGKLLTGSRVVSAKGGSLGFGRSALRLAATLAAALPLGAGFIGLWTDPGRRGWHDRIAGTKVIRG